MGARPQHSHTYDIGGILSFLKHMSVSNVTMEIGEHDTRIWRVLEYLVEEVLKLQDLYIMKGLVIAINQIMLLATPVLKNGIHDKITILKIASYQAEFYIKESMEEKTRGLVRLSKIITKAEKNK